MGRGYDSQRMLANQLPSLSSWVKSWVRDTIWMAISVSTVSLMVWTQWAQGAEPCDRAISYFIDPYPESGNQWRILDPSRGTDTLFLSLPGGFEGVRWDTTFDRVYFSSGDSVYSAQWRLGAKPRFIIQLPTGQGPWWLDRDRGSWQFLRLREQSNTSGKDNLELSRYGGELWESDGGPWRRIRADSVDYIEVPRDHWQWADGTPIPTGAPAVTLDDVASEAWEETWWGRKALFDTATVTVTRSDGAGYDSDQWFFLGMESSPRRGVAFQLSGPLAPEHDWFGVLGPFYFVDLDRRTKTLVDGTELGIMRSLVAEHCGFLLIPGVEENPLVVDSSGRRVFSPPSNSNGAVWAPRPRE